MGVHLDHEEARDEENAFDKVVINKQLDPFEHAPGFLLSSSTARTCALIEHAKLVRVHVHNEYLRVRANAKVCAPNLLLHGLDVSIGHGMRTRP